MVPAKLRQGDEVRVIAPSTSHSILSQENIELSTRRLEQLGLRVTFGKHINEANSLLTSSIESRIEDLHEAFKDENVKAILTSIGGYQANQLLSYIDYELIRNNPKIFCGYSDITALGNAIYAKSGLTTYSGIHFSSFGMEKGFEYSLEYFKKMFLDESEAIEVQPSNEWSNDSWYMDQNNRKFHPNDGYLVINEGKCEGTAIGGNLCTLNLLQGTEYMPSLENAVLFLEDDKLTCPKTFDRDLQSLIHQPSFGGVKGILIGRFEKVSNVSNEHIQTIIQTKRELANIPVVANADFGHTSPMFTFPIGGKVNLSVKQNEVEITLNTK
ncbi:peptidase S66 [Bacillus sp. LL01]|uniref:S66 family peptidase n=1 Tax=Bacillus sp. LL01 TaxID=1665556 RepID=UPI00064D5FC2|nr:S66 peptidase family protein [Bacillus sp. LL01]KMJ58710.1 peptidase S66 [Bacillus sp. LL01]